jgi:hypothetical protein
MYSYFQAIRGIDSNNINFAFGGLNFAYRDFLANLSRFDEQNKTKTIIPTELSVTLDGIGGIIIGNLFQINQDIVPKSYKGGLGRKLAYIVTKLGHSVSNNDWTTTLNAYPIIFETAKGTDIKANWKNQQYPGALIISAGGAKIVIRGSYSTDNDNNPFNIISTKTAWQGKIGSKVASNSGLEFVVFDTLENGVRAGLKNLSNYFTVHKKDTVYKIINRYAPGGSKGQTTAATTQYIAFVTNWLQKNWKAGTTKHTKLTFRGALETDPNNIKMFKELCKAILEQEGSPPASVLSAVDNFNVANLK